MFSAISNFLMILFEVFCYKLFWDIFNSKEKQKNSWIVCSSILSLAGAIYLVAIYLAEFFALKQLVIIILFIVITYLYTKESLIKITVVTTLYQELLLMVDYLAFSVNSNLFYDNNTIKQYYFVIVLGKIVLFLCIKLIRNMMMGKSADLLKDTEWVRFLFFPAFTIFTITAFITSFRYVENQTQSYILFGIAFGMAGLNMMFFCLLSDIAEKAIQNNEKRMLEIQAKNQTEMYRAISDHYDRQQKRVHEYKNKIMCMESLLEKRKYIELERYVGRISGNLKNEKDVINTNHIIINAVINTKYQEAVHKHIVFVFQINDLSTIRLSDDDIVVILYNLLNNAIEACEKCKEKRVLKLKLIKEDDKLILSVWNTCSQSAVYEGDHIITTKTKIPQEHGFGIKNIINIVEQYSGSYVIINNEKEFQFSIIIPD